LGQLSSCLLPAELPLAAGHQQPAMMARRVGFEHGVRRSQLWLLAGVVATFLCRLCPAPTGNCRPSRELPLAFLQGAEWAEKSRGLNAEDTLPLIADVTVDLGVGGIKPAQSAGRGSYIADFGILDVPFIGELRARAGLRYSRLYPRGALELGFRKVRTDSKRGYELSIGGQTSGDDRRLDVVTDIAALKRFRNARAHYRFIFGGGQPYSKNPTGGPTWCEVGSSLGVTTQQLPPNGRGELTVGWRSGFFDNGLEGVAGPMLPHKNSDQNQNRDAPKIKGLLDSTPFAAYGVDLKAGDSVGAHLSWTMLPEQNTLEHALHLRVLQDTSGGTTSLSAVVDQSLSHPQRFRVRFGGSYCRG